MVTRASLATRAVRAQRERGAALFIVVLVIVLITAIGVFAAHLTSLAQVASGYVRRASAATGVAEFALNAVTGDMNGKEADYDRFATRSTAPATCLANRKLPATTPVTCHVVDTDGAKFFMPVTLTSDAKGGVLGELGRDGTIQGTFRVEMTDVQQGVGLTAGMGATGNTQNLRQRQATLTVTGSVLPVTAPGVSMCTQAVTQASDNMTLRANISYTTP